MVKKLKKLLTDKAKTLRAPRKKKESILPMPGIQLPESVMVGPKRLLVKELANLQVGCAVAHTGPIPATGNTTSWNYRKAFELQDKHLVINQITKQYDDVYYMTYISNKKRDLGGIYVPGEYPFDLLEGKDKTAAEKIWTECVLSNLSQHLGHNFHVGCDPEIFVEDENGVVLPAFKFLGSKKKPDLFAQNTIYWDGFQAEFTTIPVGCLAYEVDYIQQGIDGVSRLAKKYNPKAKLSVKTVMDIPQEMLNDAKEEHVEFGCMPSLNAYGIKGKALPGREVPFRPVGGHIHFGCGKLEDEEVVNGIKALDAILAVACVSLFEKYDDPRRRQLYGLPGEYRLPPHGVEYRTLSNAWMVHPLITHLVFDLSRKAFMFGRKGFLKHWKHDEKETLDCIIKCDAPKAREIMIRNEAILLEIIKAAYPNAKPGEIAAVLKVLHKGVDAIVKDASDFEKNWSLDGSWKVHSEGENKCVYHSFDKLLQGKKVA